jgi:hypothetical protein
MQRIINGKKYDTETSERLYAGGLEKAVCIADGRLEIYRSKKGTMWGILSYWPNEFGDQIRKPFAGVSAAKKHASTVNHMSVDEYEKVFGAVGEG